MTRRLNWFLLALVVLIGLPYYWLLLDNRPGDAKAKPITIGQLRTLAAALPGPAPNAVELELIAFRRVPGTLFAAGTGFKRRLIGVMAWRLPVPGGKPIVIDSGFGRSIAATMDLEKFYGDAQDRTDQAMREAGLILVTHEHSDHEGGLIALHDRAVLTKALLNPSQISGNRWTELLPWGKEQRPSPALSGGAPRAVAPGVVVIPAPSHSPGSQMIFVRLGDGREFLFTGDIATMAKSWQALRARSRLIGDFIVHEDRGEVYAWLRTIRVLKATDPGLVVLPGHDFESVVDPHRPSGVHLGFTRVPV
jgi:glyoxylase-like metal-dependent hydrolase (beta-lactamase superfamily II)